MPGVVTLELAQDRGERRPSNETPADEMRRPAYNHDECLKNLMSRQKRQRAGATLGSLFLFMMHFEMVRSGASLLLPFSSSPPITSRYTAWRSGQSRRGLDTGIDFRGHRTRPNILDSVDTADFLSPQPASPTPAFSRRSKEAEIRDNQIIPIIMKLHI